MTNIEFEILKTKARNEWPHKNMIVVYLLWFFLGAFGIHRLYLSWTKTGVLMLISWPLMIFTGGFSMLIPTALWIIDIFYTYTMVNDYNAYQDKGYMYELNKAQKAENKSSENN